MIQTVGLTLSGFRKDNFFRTLEFGPTIFPDKNLSAISFSRAYFSYNEKHLFRFGSSVASFLCRSLVCDLFIHFVANKGPNLALTALWQNPKHV